MSLLKVHVHDRDASAVRDIQSTTSSCNVSSEEDAAKTTSAAGAESKHAHSAFAFDLTAARRALGPQPTAGQVTQNLPRVSACSVGVAVSLPAVSKGLRLLAARASAELLIGLSGSSFARFLDLGAFGRLL